MNGRADHDHHDEHFDPQLLVEWRDSFDAVVSEFGHDVAERVIRALHEQARSHCIDVPISTTTNYRNTISLEDEGSYPGDIAIERRIRAYTRWNAAAMVLRANHINSGIGGHLSTFASTATLYDVGWNHFFRGKESPSGKDFVFFQPHASPGIYARAYVEGRLDENQLDGFRAEADGRGLSALPHPRLMPDFWEFPTGSMGVGPLNAIYLARFNRYLEHRGLADTSRDRVWMFMGDGEADEPESIGALTLAARERLDNLIFVVNCNLQRLDGPVRGNGKIIQELESLFNGAGWNVIKIVWGGGVWDDLHESDRDRRLLRKLNAMVDGEYQWLSVAGGARVRQTFFENDPDLFRLVQHLSDSDLERLPRGGHDPKKVYAAYKQAVEHRGAPTVVLAHTVKGWALGSRIEARNATHQMKTMALQQLREFRDRLHLVDVIPDEALDDVMPPYVRPQPGSPEYAYLVERRQRLHGWVPSRVSKFEPLASPSAAPFAPFFDGSRGRAVSTTMSFTTLLRGLLRDERIGSRIVPIVSDEGRTFGMDPLFAEAKVYAPFGQLYEPVDANHAISYLESQDGQILQEGITEAGALGSFTAAGTAHVNSGVPMVPFFIFYSMFGFQRVGDFIWAFGDSGGKGFLLGATAGRTTLNGEGLQHQDGHSLVLASTVPNLRAYDAAFAYEVSVIVEDGINRMYGQHPEDCFYYLTLYNETYPMPPLPPVEGVKEGIVRGIYPLPAFGDRPLHNAEKRRSAAILFSGSSWTAAKEAHRLLAEHHRVDVEMFSVTSYKSLREDALDAERWNRLHPGERRRMPYLTSVLESCRGPFIAVTDFMKSVPDQIARWVPGRFAVLGTDGYGRSGTRSALRRHFEVDAAHIVVATLDALVSLGEADETEVKEAIAMHCIDAEAFNPQWR